MLPTLKKKVVSFLLDEKGTISKDKLLKGAIILSGIGLGAKPSQGQVTPDQAQQHYQENYANDDRGGYADASASGPDGECYVAPIFRENSDKIAAIWENWEDGGEKFLPATYILPGGGQPPSKDCISGFFPRIPLPGEATPAPFGGCGCEEGTGVDQEIKVTRCDNTLTKYCIPSCFSFEGKKWPFHFSAATTIHKNVDRSWHTNSITLTNNANQRAVEATHSHHGKHHNADTTGCIGTDQGTNTCFRAP